MSEDEVKKYKPFERGAWYSTSAAALIGFLASLLTVCLIPSDVPLDQAAGIIALAGIAIGGAGALMRAMVHRRADPSDHQADGIGKLLAVVAFTFALFAGIWRLGSVIAGGAGIVIMWVCAIVVAVSFAILVWRLAVLRRRSTEAKAGEAAAQEQEERAGETTEVPETVATAAQESGAGDASPSDNKTGRPVIDLEQKPVENQVHRKGPELRS